jgi:large subunit ribosomal protein L10
MPTPQKAATIDELSDQLSRSQLTIITDYRGLSVTDLQGLRTNLRPVDAEFRIAKNTLTRFAAEKAGIDGLSPLLEGPTALVFAYGDVVGASKVVSDFVRTSRVLTVRGGVLGTRLVSVPDITDLASMPPREELIGKLLGLMVSPIARVVGVLNGPARSVPYLLNARSASLGGAEEIAAD